MKTSCSGIGFWVEDSTMTVTCLSGNDNIGSTTLAPTIKTTTPKATTVRPTTEATTTSDGVTCIRVKYLLKENSN